MITIKQFLCREEVTKTLKEAADLINDHRVMVNDSFADQSYILIDGDSIVIKKDRHSDPITFTYPTLEPVISVSSPTKQAYMYQHLSAESDANGNPQRLYMVMDKDGNIIEAIDEEYSGFPKQLKGLVQLPGYPISTTLYWELYNVHVKGIHNYVSKNY